MYLYKWNWIFILISIFFADHRDLLHSLDKLIFVVQFFVISNIIIDEIYLASWFSSE